MQLRGVRHGHRFVHVHHEALFDYTHRLNDEYETLPLPWIEYFLVRINNLIRRNMRWHNTFNIAYDKNTQKITITGFPTHTLKRHFKIGITQTEFTLHKMDYHQAIIYIYGKNYVKLEFLTKKEKNDDPCVKVVYLQSLDDLDDLDDTNNCNVLTEPFQCYKCTCCKCQKEYGDEIDGEPDGESTTDGEPTTNDEPNTDGDNTPPSPIDDGITLP